MPRVLRVLGKVVGRVTIRDIGRDVLYNEFADIQEADVLKSADIINAYVNRWIDVVSGHEILQGHPGYNSPHKAQGMNVTQIQSAPERPIAKALPTAPAVDVGLLMDGLKNLIDGLPDKVRDIVRSEIALQKSEQPSSGVELNNDRIAEIVVGKIAGMIPTMPTSPQRSSEKVSQIDKESQNVFIGLDDKSDLKSSISEEGVGQVVESNDEKAGAAIKALSILKKEKGT